MLSRRLRKNLRDKRPLLPLVSEALHAYLASDREGENATAPEIQT